MRCAPRCVPGGSGSFERLGKLARLVIVAPTAYGPAHRAQNPEDRAQDDQDDADRPQEAEIEDGGKDEADDSENDQLLPPLLVRISYPMTFFGKLSTDAVWQV
jgi:hypothetical protein